MAKSKDQHKGHFVGAYLEDEQFEKLERVERSLAEIFGEGYTSRSKALRYVIDYFDEALLPSVPKANGRKRAEKVAE